MALEHRDPRPTVVNRELELELFCQTRPDQTRRNQTKLNTILLTIYIYTQLKKNKYTGKYSSISWNKKHLQFPFMHEEIDEWMGWAMMC